MSVFVRELKLAISGYNIKVHILIDVMLKKQYIRMKSEFLCNLIFEMTLLNQIIACKMLENPPLQLAPPSPPT